jgi:hypothetical protein
MIMELSVLHLLLTDHKDNTTAKTGVVNKSSGTLIILPLGDWYRFYIEKSGVQNFKKNS